MNLLDRLLEHDAWTTRQLLDRARGLSDEALDREFDLGPKSLRKTFAHIIRNMEGWAALMAGRAVERVDTSPARTIEQLTERLDRAAAELARVARDIEARDAWDQRWLDTLDDPPTEKSFGGAIAHVITHSMHHRAQLIYMLRQVGVTNLPEGDVLSWEQAMNSSRG